MKLLCSYVHVTQGIGGETVRDGLILLISLSICEDSFLLSGNNSYRAKKTWLKGNEEKPKETGRCCFPSGRPRFCGTASFPGMGNGVEIKSTRSGKGLPLCML